MLYQFNKLNKYQHVHTARKYDPRWIALHGLDVFSENVVAFEPKEKWGAIDDKTRNEYYDNFKEAMSQIKKDS